MKESFLTFCTENMVSLHGELITVSFRNIFILEQSDVTTFKDEDPVVAGLYRKRVR